MSETAGGAGRWSREGREKEGGRERKEDQPKGREAGGGGGAAGCNGGREGR